MRRASIAAALLASAALLTAGFLAGRATATASRAAQEIPASAFAPVWVQSAVGEPDPGRPGTPQRSGSPATARGVLEPVGSTPGPESSTTPARGSVSEAKAWARSLLGARQYACLDAIANHESRWNPLARNARTGAFGIPQALHGLTSTDPLVQVRWMLDYVARRYGTACAAWAHVEEFSWY